MECRRRGGRVIGGEGDDGGEREEEQDGEGARGDV